ncbi:CCR4-NOT transcription complex subunit 7 [Mortierella sp. 14UC]|nr:CCR4-NOT transcription complex subunit 7 [Mortierella sp. 14UC]
MPSPERSIIREVWAENLDQEMTLLRGLVDHYPYLAMDTEFPGVVARPIGNFRTSADYHYQTLRCNVDLLKMIQLGITFADENGNVPKDACTWQFNFKFSLSDDMYAQDSIDLLIKSGINFQKHEDYGIDIHRFGELLISSGFVLLDDVKWISFHSGYDFGYLLKVLTCSPLPGEEPDFFELLRTYFPCIYDIKYLMKSCKNLKGGLQDLANDLQVVRIGAQHQAGSDSLLTCSAFFKMRQIFFDDAIDDSKYLGYLYGLGSAVGSTAAQPVNSIATFNSAAGNDSPLITNASAGLFKMSADLTWLLIKNNNSFLVKRSGVQFSSEAGNLLNKNSFKFSGLANKKTIDIAAAASGRGVVVSTPKNKVTLTKGIRKSARSVAGLTRAGYRADLRKAALARVAAVLATQKPVKVAAKKASKGVRANKN